MFPKGHEPRPAIIDIILKSNEKNFFNRTAINWYLFEYIIIFDGFEILIILYNSWKSLYIFLDINFLTLIFLYFFFNRGILFGV